MSSKTVKPVMRSAAWRISLWRRSPLPAEPCWYSPFFIALSPTTSSAAATHGCQERLKCSAMWLSGLQRTLSTTGSLEKWRNCRQGSAEQAALGEQL